MAPDKDDFCTPEQLKRHKLLVKLGYKPVAYNHTLKYLSVHYTDKDDEMIAHYLKCGGFKFFSKDG